MSYLLLVTGLLLAGRQGRGHGRGLLAIAVRPGCGIARETFTWLADGLGTPSPPVN